VEPRTCKGLNRLFFTEKGSGTWFCAEWHKASEVARRERRGIDKKRRCSADNSLGGEAEGLGWLGRSAAEREQINERQRGRFWAAMAAYDAELEAIVRAGEAILDLV